MLDAGIDNDDNLTWPCVPSTLRAAVVHPPSRLLIRRLFRGYVRFCHVQPLLDVDLFDVQRMETLWRVAPRRPSSTRRDTHPLVGCPKT